MHSWVDLHETLHLYPYFPFITVRVIPKPMFRGVDDNISSTVKFSDELYHKGMGSSSHVT
jgi:hypothetical protein